MNQTELQQKTFLLLLTAVSIAFAWIVWPFFGAVFWGIVLAILFAPFYQRLLRATRQRRTLAAVATLLISLIGVGIPLAYIAASLVGDVLQLYASINARRVDLGAYFHDIVHGLPPEAMDMLDRLGLGDLSTVQAKLSNSTLEIGRVVAGHALNIGQNTFQFLFNFGVMLYLLFFLLRDGVGLAAKIEHALPLDPVRRRHLFTKFTMVIRATVRGNVLIAITEGALGAGMLWLLGVQGPLLWGAVMGIVSMVPLVGAALLWAPIAVYFIVTGEIWKGVALILFGVVGLGLVDNVLRPLLIGQGTRMADYVVLISTLGGIVIFGINGFVIGPLIAALFIAAWDLFATDVETP